MYVFEEKSYSKSNRSLCVEFNKNNTTILHYHTYFTLNILLTTKMNIIILPTKFY